VEKQSVTGREILCAAVLGFIGVIGAVFNMALCAAVMTGHSWH
jgi:hypothetical protein